MGRQCNTGYSSTELQKLDSLCPRSCKMEKRRWEGQNSQKRKLSAWWRRRRTYQFKYITDWFVILLQDFSIVSILLSKDSEEMTLHGVQVQISVIHFMKILVLYIQCTHILEQTYSSGNVQQYSIPAHLSQKQKTKNCRISRIAEI